MRVAAGLAGAWLSDFAFFLTGYSIWWAVLVGGRVWLGSLARVLRANAGSPLVAEKHGNWPIWLGLALLLLLSRLLLGAGDAHPLPLDDLFGGRRTVKRIGTRPAPARPAPDRLYFGWFSTVGCR